MNDLVVRCVARATRACAAAAVGLTLAVGLTACGDDTRATTSQVSTTEHNDADVTFATNMIQHHAQALVMVDMTLGRRLDPEVAALAEDIRAAQGPEIETMVDWLTEWGEEVPETVRDHVHAGHDTGDLAGSMEGMDHGDLPGMMTAEEMEALADASGAEFQDRWLEMMVEHHEGAVEMARTEQEEGRYKPAVDLAGDIIDSQSAEIDTMKALLGS